MSPEKDAVTLAMFMATALLGGVNLLFAFILNSFRAQIKEMTERLHELNDAVLGRYMPRADVEAMERELYHAIHKCRQPLQQLRSDVDVLMALGNVKTRKIISDPNEG